MISSGPARSADKGLDLLLRVVTPVRRTERTGRSAGAEPTPSPAAGLARGVGLDAAAGLADEVLPLGALLGRRGEVTLGGGRGGTLLTLADRHVEHGVRSLVVAVAIGLIAVQTLLVPLVDAAGGVPAG